MVNSSDKIEKSRMIPALLESTNCLVADIGGVTALLEARLEALQQPPLDPESCVAHGDKAPGGMSALAVGITVINNNLANILSRLTILETSVQV